MLNDMYAVKCIDLIIAIIVHFIIESLWPICDKNITNSTFCRSNFQLNNINCNCYNFGNYTGKCMMKLI